MCRRFKLPLAALLAIGLCTASVLAGKPDKNPPPPPPPPPVTYGITTFSMPTLGGYVSSVQMNASGMVVGYYVQNSVNIPYIYDAFNDNGVARDLNDIGIEVAVPTPAEDPPQFKPLSEAGWRIAVALDINELGFVVGGMERFDNPGIYRGFLLDLSTRQLFTLPDGPGHTYARRINDNMDILGVAIGSQSRAYLYNPSDTQITDLGIDLYWDQVELSNPAIGAPAQVVGMMGTAGTVFRYTAGVGLETNFGLPVGDYRVHPYDISPNGKFCGGLPKPKTRHGYLAYRFGSNLETFSSLPTALAINAHGDMCFAGKTMYHEGTNSSPSQLIDLTTTLVGAPADLAIWNDANSFNSSGADMTERGSINPAVPNFPGLCGTLFGSNGSLGFVLIPVAP